MINRQQKLIISFRQLSRQVLYKLVNLPLKPTQRSSSSQGRLSPLKNGLDQDTIFILDPTQKLPNLVDERLHIGMVRQHFRSERYAISNTYLIGTFRLY